MEVLIARGESVHQLHNEEEFPSGQREQTVNLSLFSFGGSNPPSSTKKDKHILCLSFLFILFCISFFREDKKENSI